MRIVARETKREIAMERRKMVLTVASGTPSLFGDCLESSPILDLDLISRGVCSRLGMETRISED